MKKLLVAAAIYAASTLAALAQATGLTYVPLGYCQLTSVDTAVFISTCVIGGVTGIPAGASRAIITPEAQAIRYRDDASAPTASVGMPVAVGVTLDYSGTLSKVRVISQTSGAKVNISFYR